MSPMRQRHSQEGRLWLALIFWALAILACGTVVTDTPYYTCPTPIPATAAPHPTVLPGTPLPFPTLIPLLPTPYSITPPQDFYTGDTVFVGLPGALLRLRFRLNEVISESAQPLNGEPRSLYTWALTITNLGEMDYETVPVVLMSISRVETSAGLLEGAWTPTESAMQAAGFTQENYTPLTAGATRTYHFAAYAPAGTVHQFRYLLDGAGDNRITWVNAPNPFCSGDSAP